jgi:hypothetical protein
MNNYKSTRDCTSLVDIFCRPGRVRWGRNFHYTTGFNFCQAFFAKKLHKIFFPQLCNLPIEIRI